jgi:thioredoxin 1
MIRETDHLGLRSALEAHARVLAEFWAPWCSQCGPMTRVVERFSVELPGDVNVVKVSVEEDGVADEYGIMNLPAMCLFIDGKPVKLVSGFKSAAALRQEFSSLLGA